MSINFSVSKRDHKILNQIADRAVAVAQSCDIEYNKITALMDLTAVHANGNPLRLGELLEANDFDFNHDVFGIRRHIDRETGLLRDFFVPRFSVPQRTAVQQ